MCLHIRDRLTTVPGRMSQAEDALKKNTFIISFPGYILKVMVIFLEQDIIHGHRLQSTLYEAVKQIPLKKTRAGFLLSETPTPTWIKAQ